MKIHFRNYLRLVFPAMAMFLAFGVLGQSRQISFGGGVNSISLRDQAYSPLVYSGVCFDGFVGLQATKERKESIWLLSAGRTNLSNAYSRNLSTTAIRLTNLNFYARAKEDANLRWGWSNNNGFHHRLIDDFQNFNGRVDFFTTFGPAAIYEVPLALKGQSFKFRATAHVQLIGIYLPSGYVASLPSGFGYEPNNFVGAVVQSMRIFHPGSSFNAGLWPQLEWLLNSGNGIAVNYLYEYSHFSNPHRSIRSSGLWFITFNMTLQ